jgi:hypothetical protein
MHEDERTKMPHEFFIGNSEEPEKDLNGQIDYVCYRYNHRRIIGPGRKSML